jgi:hypothetical protein
VPILDGSASSFVFLLQSAGVVEQSAPKRFVRVLKPVEVSEGEGENIKWARLTPYHGYKLSFEIDFRHPAVDSTGQSVVFDMDTDVYTRDIARARTFGFTRDVEMMRAHGLALGGGLELAMASHIRLASTNARMGLPEVSLGVIPGYGGTQRLAQLVGRGKANEMVFTAGMINASDALSWGLVNYVVEPDQLLVKAEEIAVKIIHNSGTAIAAAIESINANFTDGVNGYDTEITAFGNCFGTADFKEGTTAFLEKRKANFRGE